MLLVVNPAILKKVTGLSVMSSHHMSLSSMALHVSVAMQAVDSLIPSHLLSLSVSDDRKFSICADVTLSASEVTIDDGRGARRGGARGGASGEG